MSMIKAWLKPAATVLNSIPKQENSSGASPIDAPATKSFVSKHKIVAPSSCEGEESQAETPLMSRADQGTAPVVAVTDSTIVGPCAVDVPTAPSVATVDASGLSEYERERLQRVARNQAVMAALGLDSIDFRLAAGYEAKNLKSAGGGNKVTKGNAVNGASADAGVGGKHCRSSDDDVDGNEGQAPPRRSRRVSGQPALAHDGSCTETEGRYRYMPQDDSWVAPTASYDDRRWMNKQKRSSVVGTASYSHTLMRVRSMSEKALANRIKTIERAKGVHAVAKMRLFARVLCLKGYDELASDATDALGRLIEILGDEQEESAEESAGEEDVADKS